MPPINTSLLVNIKDLAPQSYPATTLVSIAVPKGPTLYLASRSQPGLQSLVYNGKTYQCRISRHIPGTKQMTSPEGIDTTGTYGIEIADADYSYMSVESQY